jgi:predicted small secreted protein
MLRKLSCRIYLAVILALSLSGCGAIRGVGNALANSFKGFSISFPTIHFP